MSSSPRQTVVVQQAPGASGLSIAGLIFSILGWFTCGLLCIPGALLSFFGLFSKGPKGMAIAGLIVGFPGTLFFGFIGLGLIMSILGLGAATTGAVSGLNEAIEEEAARLEQEAVDTTASGLSLDLDIEEDLSDSSLEEVAIDEPAGLTEPEDEGIETETQIEVEFEHVSGELQEGRDEATFDRIRQDETSRWWNDNKRTWTDKTGQHQIVAAFKEHIGDGKIRLVKEDGTTVDVALNRLSEPDRLKAVELWREMKTSASDNR